MIKLDDLKDEEDDISKYEKLVLKRHLAYIEMENEFCSKNDEITVYSEVLPKSIYADIFDLDEADMFYNHSGYSSKVFEKAGLKVMNNGSAYYLPHSVEAKKLLFTDNVKEYVFTVYVNKKQNNDDFPIYAEHDYSLEPVDIDGERKFIIRNPHNSINEIVFTYGDLCRNFAFLEAAKIA